MLIRETLLFFALLQGTIITTPYFTIFIVAVSFCSIIQPSVSVQWSFLNTAHNRNIQYKQLAHYNVYRSEDDNFSSNRNAEPTSDVFVRRRSGKRKMKTTIANCQWDKAEHSPAIYTKLYFQHNIGANIEASHLLLPVVHQNSYSPLQSIIPVVVAHTCTILKMTFSLPYV